MLTYLRLQKIHPVVLSASSVNSRRTIRRLAGRIEYFPSLKISTTLTLPSELGKILLTVPTGQYPRGRWGSTTLTTIEGAIGLPSKVSTFDEFEGLEDNP